MAVPGSLRAVPDGGGVMIFEFGVSKMNATAPIALLIPGLSDGPLSLPFAPKLGNILRAAGWRLISPILRSSFSQFGHCSVETDAEDLRAVMSTLVADAGQAVTFACFGHSTGCQDIVTLLKHDLPHGVTIGKIILQGAVSDREALYFIEDHATIAEYIDIAKVRVQNGLGQEAMPRACGELFGAVMITADRFLSFCSRMSPDDMFSSDLSDEELESRLHHIGAACSDVMVALCLHDQYVPPHIDPRNQAHRLAHAIGSAEVALINGSHNCEGAVDEMIECAARFITRTCKAMTITWECSVALEIAQHSTNPGKQTSNAQAQGRYLVGVCGIPGAGKSVSSAILAAALDCQVVSLDGFHYSKSTLASMTGADDMLYRRGAPDTFDRTQFATLLRNCKENPRAEFCAPTFDHSVGDPQPGNMRIEPSNMLVVEGIYLLLWPEVRKLLDYTIYISADLDVCLERLKTRNACIPGYTPEEINTRVDVVDRSNCAVVTQTEQYADLKVPSMG